MEWFICWHLKEHYNGTIMSGKNKRTLILMICRKYYDNYICRGLLWQAASWILQSDLALKEKSLMSSTLVEMIKEIFNDFGECVKDFEIIKVCYSCYWYLCVFRNSKWIWNPMARFPKWQRWTMLQSCCSCLILRSVFLIF